jgi:hypothetical protein
MKLLAQEVKKFKKKLKEAKNGQKGARSSYHDDSHRSTMGYACWPRQFKFYFGNKSVHRATMTSIAARWHFSVIDYGLASAPVCRRVIIHTLGV